MSSIKIAVVGDARVGKTSIIKTFVARVFTENVPSLMDKVYIPADRSFRERVPFLIFDTSSSPKELNQTEHILSEADSIILVCDVKQPESVRRVVEYQVLYLEKIDIKCPVIVALNKFDSNYASFQQESESSSTNSLNYWKRLMDSHFMIDMVYECSAELNLRITELFHLAHSSVIFPLLPLFDTRADLLKTEYVQALTRIFRICDEDKDSYLNEEEIKKFQERCFGVGLSSNDIDQLLLKLQNQKPSENGFTGSNISINSRLKNGDKPKRSLDFSDFVQFNKMFVRNRMTEFCQKILFEFGYGYDLKLITVENEEYNDNKFENEKVCFNGLSKKKKICPLVENWLKQNCESLTSIGHVPKAPKHSDDSSCELTFKAYEYLKEVWFRFDLDKNTEDVQSQFQNLNTCFEPIPEDIRPYPNDEFCLETVQHPINSHNFVDKEGFPTSNDVTIINDIKHKYSPILTLNGQLSLQTAIAYFDPDKLLLLISYLGFPIQKYPALIVTTSKSVDKNSEFVDRRVLHTYIFGSPKSGKTTFSNRLLGLPFSDFDKGSASKLRHVVGRVEVNKNQEDTNLEKQYLDLDEDIKANSTSEYYLILTEVKNDCDTIASVIENEIHKKADTILLMYDTSDSRSLEYVLEIMEPFDKQFSCLPDQIPVQFVATKSDLNQVEQFDGRDENEDIVIDIIEICRDRYKLAQPEISRQSVKLPYKFFESLIEISIYPEPFRPESARRARKRRILTIAKQVKRSLTLGFLFGILYFGSKNTWRRFLTNESLTENITDNSDISITKQSNGDKK